MAYIYDDEGKYKRTIRCGWCYGVGHSQRTCPDRYPNGTPAQQRAKATKAAKAAAREANGGRMTSRCSYCKETGHQRRKCETLAQDKDRLTVATIAYRKLAADTIARDGLAPGALLRTNEEYYDHKSNKWITAARYSIVTHIDSDQLTPAHNWYVGKRDYRGNDVVPLKHVWVSGPQAGQTGVSPLPTALDQQDVEQKEFAAVARNHYNQDQVTASKVIFAVDTAALTADLLDTTWISPVVDDYFKGAKSKECYKIIRRLEHLANNDEL